MKKLLIILLFITCSPERSIEVKNELWILVEIKTGQRVMDNDFIWLIWENKSGIRYWEKVSTTNYEVGMKIYNKI